MFIEINPRTSAISVKVISFFELSFVSRKIVSGTTRFPPLHLFNPRYDQILSPCHPPGLSCQECFHIFFLFWSNQSIHELQSNLSSVALYNFKHSPCIECHSHGWRLNTGLTVMENCICPHFLHQTQIISMIDFMTPNFSHFPQVTDCGIFLEIVNVRMF